MRSLDVQLAGVSKRYRRRQPQSLAQWLRGRRARPHSPEAFWAVRDVSFDVPSGQVLGIVGSNGAGKSTLLKLLSGITAPTCGEIRYRGRLAALIEVGSGFHPELTGRENVFMSGAILGMSRREIAAKLDSIVAFSGVADFIDTPVKWYSSGMYVRLGFAVAAHVDPDVLLVDEVLAVGDEAFQEKCFARVAELRSRGTTVIFISHDLTAVERLCDRALLLEHGCVALDDVPGRVVTSYRASVGVDAAPASADTGPAVVTRIAFTSPASHTAHRTGDPLVAAVDLDVREPIDDLVVTLAFASNGGAVLHSEFTTGFDGVLSVARGPLTIEFTADALGLQPGAYSAIATLSRGYGRSFDSKLAPHRLIVEPGRMVRGYFYMPHRARVRVHAPAGVV